MNRVAKGSRVVQRHHITYRPERTVMVFKGEHKILTLMQWYCKKKVSVGFMEALTTFINKNLDRAKEIPNETKS